MKIIRYLDSSSNTLYGGLRSDGSTVELDGDLYGKYNLSERVADVKKVLALLIPSSILCIGLNYRRHAAEGGLPIPEYAVLFAKGINALQNPGDAIQIPTHLASTEVDYECELAVVIGKPCKNVPRERALDYVLGYTCANDVSARDWQLKHGGGQWCRGKFFDTFAPLGPCLATPESIPDPLHQRWHIENHVPGTPVLHRLPVKNRRDLQSIGVWDA